jgi:hypothetical protein
VHWTEWERFGLYEWVVVALGLIGVGWMIFCAGIVGRAVYEIVIAVLDQS